MFDAAALGTIWEMPEALWARIAPVLTELDPQRRGGEPRVDQRAAFNALIHRLRTACRWNRLPASFPSDSAVHRTLQRWVVKGVPDRGWADVATAAGVAGAWLALDTSMDTARPGGAVGATATPRTGARPG